MKFKRKIIFILSDIDKALAFEWIAEKLDKNKFDLAFILLNPGSSALERYLQEIKVKVYRLIYTGKKDIPSTFFKIYNILRKERPDGIHAHLFEASLIGLAAGKLAKIKKRIFTRHHGNEHHIYFPRAVIYDKLINRLATTIVAPSESVKEILVDLEGVRPEKVKVVHHGFDLTYFEQAPPQQVQLLQEKYNPGKKQPVIGVISRYTELKGLQYLIPAYKKILKIYPDAILILAYAYGDYKATIKELLETLKPESYREIIFEPDVASLYRLFDIFIHIPIESSSEAFGQTYIEALAAGVPAIFTLSGVAAEFIQDHKNALVVPFRDTNAIYEAMRVLLEDENLKSALIKQGKQDVSSRFALTKMITSLEDIYAA